MLALEHLTGLVAIDEAQRTPGLFPVLRVLVDRHLPGEWPPARFLVLGSASPDLVGWPLRASPAGSSWSSCPQLAPWFANIGKRQRKAPKVYVRDTGLLHRLLGIDDATALPRHPKVGASWVGFVIEQLATMLAPRPVWYWRTQDGAEVDLLVELGGRRVGFEIKRTSAPTRTRSMHIALRDLELDRLVVVYAGDRRFPLADRIEAIGVAELLAAPPDQIAATIGH